MSDQELELVFSRIATRSITRRSQPKLSRRRMELFTALQDWRTARSLANQFHRCPETMRDRLGHLLAAGLIERRTYPCPRPYEYRAVKKN